MPRGALLEGVTLEHPRLRLFQPDERRQLCLIDVRSARQQRARDDVEITIAIEVHGLRPADARHFGQRVFDERERTTVLEPLNPVIRLHHRIIERVAVSQYHVEIAVAVEIHDLDP